MSYCRDCGTELRERSINLFNTVTGERETEKICPKNPCKHNDQYHRYKRIKKYQGFFAPALRCERCGQTAYDDV